MKGVAKTAGLITHAYTHTLSLTHTYTHKYCHTDLFVGLSDPDGQIRSTKEEFRGVTEDREDEKEIIHRSQGQTERERSTWTKDFLASEKQLNGRDCVVRNALAVM